MTHSMSLDLLGQGKPVHLEVTMEDPISALHALSRLGEREVLAEIALQMKAQYEALSEGPSGEKALE